MNLVGEENMVDSRRRRHWWGDVRMGLWRGRHSSVSGGVAVRVERDLVRLLVEVS